MNFKHRSSRIAITPGEPAGIGPDICLMLSQFSWSNELVLFACPRLLEQRKQTLKLTTILKMWDPTKPIAKSEPGSLWVYPVPLAAPCIPGQLNKDNAKYVIHCIEEAVKACQQGHTDALVTGPIQKSIINDAGIPFCGHTELLAALTHTKKVVMMLASPTLKVALVTTHLPLTEVPAHITQQNIEDTLRILMHDLKERFGLDDPTIFVAGLNPHAGENGHLGREEIDIIIPVLEKLRRQYKNIIGPLSADTLFIEKNLRQADAFVAMYHDQGLPVLKALGFGHAVNITLGMPIIRTSVDHGTALDLAGTGAADPTSLSEAIHMAQQMINSNRSCLARTAR